MTLLEQAFREGSALRDALELVRKLVNNNHDRGYPMATLPTDALAMIVTCAELAQNKLQSLQEFHDQISGLIVASEGDDLVDVVRRIIIQRDNLKIELQEISSQLESEQRKVGYYKTLESGRNEHQSP